MGVPSCGLCWLHNSGVSTPSLFSQSKNTLGLTLNQLEISFPRPNLNAIFFPLPLPPPNLHTDSYITEENRLLDNRFAGCISSVKIIEEVSNRGCNVMERI